MFKAKNLLLAVLVYPIILLFVLLCNEVFAQVDPEKACYNQVQGKIAWDNTGNRQWAEENVKRLCKGTSAPREPGLCFERVMRGGINWGSGTNWKWENAIDLCAGTNNANTTISCFQNRIKAGSVWSQAIQSCRNKVGGTGQIIATFVPQPHKSTEADQGISPCETTIFGEQVRIDRLVRTWVPVNRDKPVEVLEGVVQSSGPYNCENGTYPGPHLAHEDWPTSHFTHDFTFHVQPDPAFQFLLGIQSQCQQQVIEVEWESGLGASNEINPCRGVNTRGISCGFYSSGHRRGSSLDWPTIGDWVHVEGNWVWDRGHPPAKTEIHPPRLVAIRRSNPVKYSFHGPDPCPQERQRLVELENEIRDLESEEPKVPGTDKDLVGEARGEWLRRQRERIAEWHRTNDPEMERLWQKLASSACQRKFFGPYWATKVEVFASGDGGALWNNRGSAGAERVNMADRDYSIELDLLVPAPTAPARLRWHEARKPGDSFPKELEVNPIPVQLDSPSETSLVSLPPRRVRIKIPWKSEGVSNSAVVSRSFLFYWDSAAEFRNSHFRTFEIHLDKIHILRTMDSFGSLFNDGEFRVFAEAAGSWFFVNELPADEDILNEGLGDTGADEYWNINKRIIVHVGPAGFFRVHAGGWEADGINDAFGLIIDANRTQTAAGCANAIELLKEQVILDEGVISQGGRDDPIGEVNQIFSAKNGYGVGSNCRGTRDGDKCKYSILSSGSFQEGKFPGGLQDTHPSGAFRLLFSIREVSDIR